MIEFKLDSLENIDETLQGLYEQTDTGYQLKVTGIPEPEKEDLSGLKNKVDELLREKKAASQKAREAAEEADAARLEAAKKGNDTEALDKSWQEKFNAREVELKKELEELSGTLVKLTSGQTATKIAAEIAVQGSADVLLPHLERRLRTEFRDGSPVTVVLDKDGKPSAMSIDELKAEFQNSAAFAPLIVGTKANGAGRTGGNESSGAGVNEVSRSEFDRMNQAQRANFAKNGGKLKDD
tara:strand:+ start:1190 stop:1906 length:717 start_codon:yes stop_codon:yes gene_type:complete